MHKLGLLLKDPGPPPLSECYDAPNAVFALSESWKLILAVDYKPIFEAGRSVLNCLDSPQFGDAIKSIIEWARIAVGQIGGLRHDVMGRIFHKLLESRYDGSFYTSVPASIILAGLALRNKRDIPPNLKNMRIIDPACGTGTLLIAAAERIKDITENKYDDKVIIEDVLTGIDINVTALHIAATTLGLLSPTTRFKKMDIRQAPFGRTDDGKIAAGSLELYGESGTFPIYNWADTKAMQQIETEQKRPSVSYTSNADLVIMNPPFTRNDLRHDQLGEELEELVKKRESDIFHSAPFPVNKASSGPMFLVLAEHLVKKSGTVALVLPFVAATNKATLRIRKFFAERFYVDTLVVSHDPTRVWFSENTGIPEILVVLKAKKRNKPTTLIQLATNPENASMAATLVSKICHNDTHIPNVQVSTIPCKLIANGDWSNIQFFSQYLADIFTKIKYGDIFSASQLKSISDIHYVGRQVRDKKLFYKADMPGRYSWGSIYGAESDKLKTIQNDPYTYLHPKNGKYDKAFLIWKKRGHFLLPERLRTDLTHVGAVYSQIPTLGSAWLPVLPKFTLMNDNKNNLDVLNTCGKEWSKTMALYFNSTLGILSLLGVRDPKVQVYPRWSYDNLQTIPVPDLLQSHTKNIAKIYDKYATVNLLQWRHHDDPTRVKFDKIISKLLGISTETVDRARLELAREPMCTGKRYV